MKTWWLVVVCLFSTGCWADSSMQETIIESCTRTANSYPYSRDRLDYEVYGDLFTKDAVFELQGDRTVGRDAIVDALRTRGPRAVTRHFSNVVHMEVTGAAKARGVSYLALYRASPEDMADGHNQIAGPAIVAEYHDQFEFEDGQCRIAERVVKIIFQGPE